MAIAEYVIEKIESKDDQRDGPWMEVSVRNVETNIATVMVLDGHPTGEALLVELQRKLTERAATDAKANERAALIGLRVQVPVPDPPVFTPVLAVPEKERPRRS